VDWSSAAALAVSIGALIVAGLSYRHAVRSSRRQQTAELHAETLAMRHPDAQEDEFKWRITNEGPAIARQVQLLVKTPYMSTDPPPLGPPMQSGESREITFAVPHTLTRSGAPLSLWARWSDGTGSREKELLRLLN
jgi:hypothetical protein